MDKILSDIGVVYNRKKNIENLIKLLKINVSGDIVCGQNVEPETIFVGAGDVFNKYNLNVSTNLSWMFFRNNINNPKREYQPFIEYPIYAKNKNITNKEEQENRTCLWKLMFNVNHNCFVSFLDKILGLITKAKLPIDGKIPFIKGRDIKSCQDPQILCYIYDVDVLRKIVKLISENLQGYDENIKCTFSKTREMVVKRGKDSEDKFTISQFGPSFTKAFNQYIYYGQSGFTESGRSKLIEEMPPFIQRELNSYIKNNNVTRKISYQQTLKIQRYILNLIYDGPDFYKYKGYIDPLEDENITQMRNEIWDRHASKFQTMGTLCNSLLFTHNTSVETFLQIISGYDQSLWAASDRGAQFRYGLDSQYGEVKFIMKKSNYLLKQYIQRQKDDDIIVDGRFEGKLYPNEPYFLNFFKKGEPPFLSGEYKKLNDELYRQAHNYDFRRFVNVDTYYDKDKNEILQIPAGEYCSNEGQQPSWCNMQLHLGNNISLRHVECVLVPEFLFSTEFNTFVKENDPKIKEILGKETMSEFIDDKFNKIQKQHDETRHGIINYLYNKLIRVQECKDYKKYYGYIRDHHSIPAYLTAIRDQNLKEHKLNQKTALTYRPISQNGNSSVLGTSIDYYKYEERMYFKILLYNNCFLDKYDIGKIRDKLIKIEKDPQSSESEMDYPEITK